MADSTADVVICGAGIAGIAAAYHLSVKHGIQKVVLVDEGAPLSLTSDKSTECYRNWWPGPGDVMVRLMNRSIDILEELARESDNRFHMNRRGYLFATADPGRVQTFRQAAEEAASLGAGGVRYHRAQAGDSPYLSAPAQGFEGQPTGSDLITDQALIRKHFPYLSERTVAVVHPRRCGWLSAQQWECSCWKKPGNTEPLSCKRGLRRWRYPQAGWRLFISGRRAAISGFPLPIWSTPPARSSRTWLG
jgi:glycine/D-amino acid oxidase-like deaminating enzyme